MANAISAVDAAMDALQSYLATKVVGLTVRNEWPRANEKLNYPTVTLFSGKVTSMNRQPEEISRTLPDPLTNTVLVTEVIGEHDFKIQLDLWCSTKQMRTQYLSLISDAINAQIVDGTGKNNPAGLSLQLPAYFNDWIRYDIDGHQNFDDEASAQRQERRVKIDLLVNCRAIRTRTYYAMVTLETLIQASSANLDLSDDASNTETFT